MTFMNVALKQLTPPFVGIGIDGKSKEEVILLKKTGKVKALEDDIEIQKDSLNFDHVHNVHSGISHTRYSTKLNKTS